jgi:hypothetical protein
MPFDFGDVVLVPFPFTSHRVSKKRPAVVVSNRTYTAPTGPDRSSGHQPASAESRAGRPMGQPLAGRGAGPMPANGLPCRRRLSSRSARIAIRSRFLNSPRSRACAPMSYSRHAQPSVRFLLKRGRGSGPPPTFPHSCVARHDTLPVNNRSRRKFVGPG